MRHVRELGQSVVPDRPGEPELTQLVAQRGLVERAGGLGLGVELLAVQRGKATVGAAGHVRDQDVRVQLRVTGAGGAVPERRRDEPNALQPGDAVLAAADLAGLPLQVASAAETATSCARRTSSISSGPPSANSSDTPFGAENVRS